ncbi:MAG: hypothetical protein HY204_07570 [Nitrospirae bacterium]|nr:hypothetical protein [Nitrospirota bacterium]
MGSTAIVLMIGLVTGYLFIEQVFVTPPKFLPFYILLSVILVMMTV